MASSETEPPPSRDDSSVKDSEDSKKLNESGDGGGVLSFLRTEWLAYTKSQRKGIPRSKAEAQPMSRWNRFKARFQKLGQSPTTEQYFIPPQESRHWWDFWKQHNIRKRRFFISESSLSFLILHFLVLYFVCVALFALAIQVFVRIYYNTGEQQCVTNYDYSKVSIINTDNYLVLFGLSWTTFSTVGYGVIGVSTEDGCQALRYFLAIEAFLGVMYSGYSGALIFSNMSQFLARAHVTFSSSLCLQYGSGLTGQRVTYRKMDRETIEGNLGKESSGGCPVIEMRLVNDRAGKGAASGISDAYLQCIVVTSEDFQAGSTGGDGCESDAIGNAKVTTKHELEIEPRSLPYFQNGSWYLQHVMNENSPLLKESVRERIKENGGEWPSDLNDWRRIRDCLSDKVEFIAVIMKGTSSLTSNDIFKTIQYSMEDIYIGYKFVEIGYFNCPDPKHDLAHSVGYDLSLVHDIKPQSGGGNEPLGSQVDKDADSKNKSDEDAHSITTDVDRHYMWQRGRRRSYDRFLRSPETSAAMSRSSRRRKSLSAKIRYFFGKSSNGEVDPDGDSRQYHIPPRNVKRMALIDRIIPEHPFITFTLWMYHTSIFYAFFAFLFGYFVLIWLFALLIDATEPSCLSGWEDAPSGFIASFYIPFQVSWATFSTVGYGGVAPVAGETCRGLNVILSAEGFLGVIFSSYCSSILLAKVSRNESIANVSFSSAACLRYPADCESKEKATDTDASSFQEDVQFPFLEIRLLNEDAQASSAQGQIIDASVNATATAFTVKLSPEDEKSTAELLGEVQQKAQQQNHRIVQHSLATASGIHWKRVCYDLKIVPNRLPVFSEAPWSLRHILDETSPLLKTAVRKRIKELGCWPPELNNHEEVRKCLSTNVFALHLFFRGTANRTSNPVMQIHEYKPEDVFIGWKFADLAYVAKSKTEGQKTKLEVKYDRCLLNDIRPQKGANKAEPIHVVEEDSDNED